MSQNAINICWLRRDLRLHDNKALFEALKAINETNKENQNPVLPIFIFDKEILDKLPNKQDKRVQFIHNALTEIQQQLLQLAPNNTSNIAIFYGNPIEIFEEITQKYTINAVFTNHDYEPYGIKRDTTIADFLKTKNINFHTFKDQCIFEKKELLSGMGTPYTVFTPYSKKWKEKFEDNMLDAYPTEDFFANFLNEKNDKQNILQNLPKSIISLEKMGFEPVIQDFPSKKVREDIIKNYKENRDFPAIEGTTRLGVHLRFGTISIRELAKTSKNLSEGFLNELIWRDFYMQILWNFPHVATSSFRQQYDLIEWRNNEEDFLRWCEGKTGYPIVDAGMRELNATGYMHNRVRMIVASFLTKHLLIHWQWGEAYFAEKLLDFDMAANNGGWQWAAGSGCDAAPYFRVFNPSEQTKKFDAKLAYIRQWVPEFSSFAYPTPMVEHKFARDRAIGTYKKGLTKE